MIYFCKSPVIRTQFSHAIFANNPTFCSDWFFTSNYCPPKRKQLVWVWYMKLWMIFYIKLVPCKEEAISLSLRIAPNISLTFCSALWAFNWVSQKAKLKTQTASESNVLMQELAFLSGKEWFCILCWFDLCPHIWPMSVCPFLQTWGETALCRYFGQLSV